MCDFLMTDRITRAKNMLKLRSLGQTRFCDAVAACAAQYETMTTRLPQKAQENP